MDIILTKLLHGAETLKGSIYVGSISLVEQPTQLTYGLADDLLIAKSTGACTFFE